MGSRFDELTKALAGGQSRRRALGILATGALAAAAGAVLGNGPADAAEFDDENDPCVRACRQVWTAGTQFYRCVRRSRRCPPGSCNLFGNGCGNGNENQPG
jgi:hypothetical protein